MDVEGARNAQLRNIEQSTGTPLADWFALIERRRSEGLKQQFAVLTPATRTRIDVGLNLGDMPPTGRLERATGMCSHRVRVSSIDEVDDEFAQLLRTAYERA